MKRLTPEIAALKTQHLNALAEYAGTLYRAPKLRHLFLELTLRCNEHCFHCGSSCGDLPSPELPLSVYKRLLDEVKEDFDIREIQLCITGGEPLLRKDFFDILGYAHELGFEWGMTSNAILVDKETAHRLAECGMGTISVSIDGLRETHDRLRGLKGAYDRAMAGIRNLIDEDAFQSVQVTTVINHRNIDELPQLFEIMDALDIVTEGARGTVVTNPPYGERLMTREEAERLYRDMGRAFSRLDRWQFYILTSHEDLGRLFGRRPDKVRKLYNGMLPCKLYQFYKNQ